jgi:predicted kinase
MGIALITKDDIKEILFETLGWKDRTWSKRLGRASMALLYYYAEVLVKSNNSVILESNFHPEEAIPRLQELRQKCGVEMIEIQCTAKREILVERLQERAMNKVRHPGHNDDEYLREFKNLALDLESYRHQDTQLLLSIPAARAVDIQVSK